MASRTSTQKTYSQAVRNLENGTVHFRALSVVTHDEGDTYYSIAVPKALMRNGLFPKPCAVALSPWGQRTKFGDDLYRAFDDIEGVEPSMDNDTPHQLTLFISYEVIREMPSSYLFATRKLPLLICVIIEEVILRNNSLGQRFAEWLRRVF